MWKWVQFGNAGLFPLIASVLFSNTNLLPYVQGECRAPAATSVGRSDTGAPSRLPAAPFPIPPISAQTSGYPVTETHRDAMEQTFYRKLWASKDYKAFGLTHLPLEQVKWPGQRRTESSCVPEGQHRGSWWSCRGLTEAKLQKHTTVRLKQVTFLHF